MLHHDPTVLVQQVLGLGFLPHFWNPARDCGHPPAKLPVLAQAPAGYTTRLLVGVQPGGGERIQGYVLAFGATVNRCLALLFSTEATGPGVAAEVGHRLRLVADDVFGRVEIRSVDDRVRTPAPGP